MITNFIMKEHLVKKFSSIALQTTIWTKTEGRTGNINDLAPQELEELYYMFFPKEKPLTLEQEYKSPRRAKNKVPPFLYP
jgi:hypothetical protein